jgi:photosystem II stability/assembly factor-like uncharacterized protein
MVQRAGWAMVTALVLGIACGGSHTAPRTETALTSAAAPAPSASAGASAGKEAEVVARPAPKAGPVAFRCDEGVTASGNVAKPPDTATPADASVPRPASSAGAKSRTLPWRRLTPPTTVGAPDLHLLAASRETLVAAGYGIKVSVDEGKTFVDASENLERTRWGNADYVYDLAPVGEALVAVTETAAYRTTEHGKRWFRCGDPPPPADPKRVTTVKRRVAFGAGIAFLTVGRRVFTSVDGGKSWFAAPADLPLGTTDGLIVTERGLFAFNTGNFASLHRSTDHGATWKYLGPALGFQDGEGITTAAKANGKLYVSTSLGALLESTDGGDTWTRRWLDKGPDYQAPRAYRIWGVDGDLLLDTGIGLMRLGKEGKPVRVTGRRALAVAVRERDVFVLGTEYLSRSTDAGRTFKDERFTGLANDAVDKVSAYGKNVAIVASGPTVFVSGDGGATFQRGPEVAGGARVAATADGVYVSTQKGDRGIVLFQPATGGPPRPIGADQDFGRAPPVILAADDKALFLYAWGSGKYLLSRDRGATFTELAKPELQYSDRNPGLVRGDELILAPGGYLHRSRGGGPFESLRKILGPKKQIPHASFLFADGPTTYVVGGDDVVAWDAKTDSMASLAKKLPRSKEEREWIAFAAVKKKTIFARVTNAKRAARYYLSNDLGASYREVDGPDGWSIDAVATSDDGILAAGRGLWLLPVQGR